MNLLEKNLLVIFCCLHLVGLFYFRNYEPFITVILLNPF